jgi:hypothetical protein
LGHRKSHETAVGKHHGKLKSISFFLDVDIAIYGDKITFDILSKLHADLEYESPMPYFFDIVDYTHLNHQKLKEHIDRVGKIIYKNKKRG